MKQPTPQTIVLTGGGSGGHIAPLLSLAHELKKTAPDSRLIYIGQKGDKFDQLKGRYGDFDRVEYTSAGKWRRYHNESLPRRLVDFKTIALNTRDFFRVIAGTLKAWRILGRTRPQVVFSKGGYVAVPVGIAAHLRGIPIITHDSDATAGLANRIVGRWATLHTTGMSPEHYNYPAGTTKQVGVPVDPRIKLVNHALQADFKKELGLPANSLVLMVAGASLGSRAVNQIVLEIASELLNSLPKLHILHFAGVNNEHEVGQQYRELGKESSDRVKVIGFSNDFYKYSGAADVIVTRAGATSLAEFAVQGKACVVIASPFLAAGHQLENAKILQHQKAAETLTDDAEPQQLLKLVEGLLVNQQRRTALASKLSSTAKPQAAKELAEILLEAAYNREKTV